MDEGQTLTSGKHVPNLSVFEEVLVFETGLVQPDQIQYLIRLRLV